MKLSGFIFFAAIVIGLGLAGNVHGQADAEVSAEVVGTVEVTTLQNVGFGQIVQNSEPILDPNDPPSSTEVGADAQVGEFQIDSGGENDVILNYSTTVQLNGPGEDLTFTSDLVGDQDSGNQGIAAERIDGEQVTTNQDGFFYLWLGGNLGTIAPDQDFGEYNGTFTITVTFP